MSDCVNAGIRDALPDLVHGRLSDLDRATLSAHVESCPDCRAELALLREVRSSAPIAPAIDASRIAAAIPPYASFDQLAVPRRPAATGMQRVQLPWKLAAAVVLIAVGALALSELSSKGRTPERSGATAVAGGVLTADDIAIAAAEPSAGATGSSPSRVAAGTATTIGGEPGVASLSLVAGVHELSDSEIETLLSELDGIESLPSAEPNPVALSVEDIEADQ